MKKVTTIILYMNMNCMKLDSRHGLTKEKYFLKITLINPGDLKTASTTFQRAMLQ